MVYHNKCAPSFFHALFKSFSLFVLYDRLPQSTLSTMVEPCILYFITVFLTLQPSRYINLHSVHCFITVRLYHDTAFYYCVPRQCFTIMCFSMVYLYHDTVFHCIYTVYGVPILCFTVSILYFTTIFIPCFTTMRLYWVFLLCT